MNFWLVKALFPSTLAVCINIFHAIAACIFELLIPPSHHRPNSLQQPNFFRRSDSNRNSIFLRGKQIGIRAHNHNSEFLQFDSFAFIALFTFIHSLISRTHHKKRRARRNVLKLDNDSPFIADDASVSHLHHFDNAKVPHIHILDARTCRRTAKESGDGAT